MASRLPGILSLLDEDIRQSEVFRNATTHRSASRRNNERLEFLGDSVLNLVISEYLYNHEVAADEGKLSRLRAFLVKGETLGRMAQQAHLGDHLTLGAGELKSGGFRRESILADALEAIIGAVYLLKGLDYTRQYVLALYEEQLKNLPEAETLKDPKSRLQEWLQSRAMPPPAYEVVSVSGEAHRQRFVVACRVAPLDRTSTAEGSSRRAAEQEAARQLLEALLSEAK